jgi:hypothetical protein
MVTRILENHVYVVLMGGVAVTLGLAPRQADLMKGTASFVGGRVKDDSIWAAFQRGVALQHLVQLVAG